MADLEKMGATELLDAFEHGVKVAYRYGTPSDLQFYASTRAELLRRLGSAGQGEPPKHKFRPTNGNIYRCAICGSCQCDGTAPAEKEG